MHATMRSVSPYGGIREFHSKTNVFGALHGGQQITKTMGFIPYSPSN